MLPRTMASWQRVIGKVMRVEGLVASIHNNTAPRHAVCVFVATGWGTQKVGLGLAVACPKARFGIFAYG